MNASIKLWLRRAIFCIPGILLIALVWNYSAIMPEFRDPDGRWCPMAFSSNGETLAAVKTDVENPRQHRNMQFGPIVLLNADSLTPLGPPIHLPGDGVPNQSVPAEVLTVEFAPNGKYLAVLQRHRDEWRTRQVELHLFQLPDGQFLKSIPIPWNYSVDRTGIVSQFFSSDSRLLAWQEDSSIPEKRHRVRVWDIVEDRERLTLEGFKSPIFSPDGNTLAVIESATRNECNCCLHDTKSGQQLSRMALRGTEETRYPWPQFSEDGKLVAINRSVGVGHSVFVFESATGKLVLEAPWERLPQFVQGNRLMTIKEDLIVLRDVKTGQLLGETPMYTNRALNERVALIIEPVPVPRHAGMFVLETFNMDYSRQQLRWLCQKLHLNLGFGQQLNWVNAADESIQSFFVDDKAALNWVVSPDGSRMAMLGLTGNTVWRLPLAKSWLPTILAATLLAVIYFGLFMRNQRLLKGNMNQAGSV